MFLSIHFLNKFDVCISPSFSVQLNQPRSPGNDLVAARQSRYKMGVFLELRDESYLLENMLL